MDFIGGDGYESCIYSLRKDRFLLIDPKIDSFGDGGINFNSSNIVSFYKLPLIIGGFVTPLSYHFFGHSRALHRIFNDRYKRNTIITGFNGRKDALSEIAYNRLLDFLFQLGRHEITHRNHLFVPNCAIKYNYAAVAVQQETGLIL